MKQLNFYKLTVVFLCVFSFSLSSLNAMHRKQNSFGTLLQMDSSQTVGPELVDLSSRNNSSDSEKSEENGKEKSEQEESMEIKQPIIDDSNDLAKNNNLLQPSEANSEVSDCNTNYASLVPKIDSEDSTNSNDKGKENVEPDQEKSDKQERPKGHRQLIDDTNENDSNGSIMPSEDEQNVLRLPQSNPTSDNRDAGDKSNSDTDSDGNGQEIGDILGNPTTQNNIKNQANNGMRGAAGALAISGAKGLTVAAVVGGTGVLAYKYGPSIAKYVINSRPVKSVINYFWGNKNQTSTSDLSKLRFDQESEDALRKAKEETENTSSTSPEQSLNRDKGKEKINLDEEQNDNAKVQNDEQDLPNQSKGLDKEEVKTQIDQKKLEEERQKIYEQIVQYTEDLTWAQLYKNVFDNEYFIAKLKKKIQDNGESQDDCMQIDKLIKDGAKNPLILVDLANDNNAQDSLVAKFREALNQMSSIYSISLSIIINKYLQVIVQENDQADKNDDQADQSDDEVGTTSGRRTNNQEEAFIDEVTLEKQLQNARNESWKKIYGDIFVRSLTPKQMGSEEIVMLISKGAENPAIFESQESNEQLLVASFLSTLNETQHKCLEVVIAKYLSQFAA